MKTQATFEDWNFETIWGIEESETYPYLQLPNDFIIIRTLEESQAINNGLDKKYVLANNIDFENFLFTPIGTENAPFSGIFEGFNTVLEISTFVYIGVVLRSFCIYRRR
jgi:hypothetical protein